MVDFHTEGTLPEVKQALKIQVNLLQKLSTGFEHLSRDVI